MKTPEEWMSEYERMRINYFENFDEFIEAIQQDALRMANCPEDLLEQAEINVNHLHEKSEFYRAKWLEARKHLRAANKGAERNAQALALATARYWDCRDSDRNDKQHDEYKHKTVVWNWLLMSDDEYRLKCGELSSQDLRNIRAVLKAMLGTSLIKHL